VGGLLGFGLCLAMPIAKAARPKEDLDWMAPQLLGRPLGFYTAKAG